MSSLGDLYFVLGLDDKKFNDAIKAAKEKIEGLGADVEVGINIDLNKVAKKVRDELTKLDGLTGGDKTIGLSVQVKEDTLNAVRSQLATLEAQRTVKLSVEYDNEKFQAVTTALKNYTDSLNNLGKIRLGIDDSFLRTGVSSTNGKGLKGFLGNMSDYLFGDDSGEVSKSIGQIQKVLNNYTFKLKAVIDEQLLINSLNAASKKKIPLNVGVNMDIAAIQKKLNALKVPLTFNSKQAIADIKAKLKNETFKAKLELVVDKAKVSKAVKAALEKQGLNYNTTASDVRAKKIEEIQQRMTIRQKKFDGQVKKSASSTNKLGSSMRRASDWASQLSNQFNNFISLYSMERFIRNLYTIGGEFQKQQIALQNMIGDVDKGNAIFERMKDLAVKSPFTFSDLASYTKQMSAYGIEYDELYDTTKRLADISAGVGVDMGRLILAFGQVRSAAVLRGQELRQFTEAGIPLVAELAKKFSELEGRVVSTGEVFDKISKREVSFGMVKDILYDMTDPGGRFFETQERLAESLAGKWSNLKDAWDIMIADIANGNNSVLSGLADILNRLIRGFDTWLPFVSGAVVALGLLRGAISAVNIAASVNPWVLIGSVLAGVTTTIISFATETETVAELVARLNRELETTVAENADKERNANRYLDILKEQAKTEDEKLSLEKKQKKAFQELLELYPKALEVEELELMTLEEIEKTRKRIAEQTKKDTLTAYDKRIEDSYNAYEEKRIEANRIARDAGLTIDSFPETKKELDDLYELYINAMNAKENYEQSLIDSLKPIKKEEWMLKAEEIIAKYPNISIRKPSNEDRYTYFDYLEEQFKDAKDKYERAVTNELRKPQKSIMDAFNAVNMAIGGKSFYDKKKKGKTEAEKAAERDAKAYYDTLKAELSKISSQWDLYKEVFDVTGNRSLALNLAFDGEIPGFDNYIEHLKGKMTEEIKKRGLNISADELLAMGKEGVASKVNDKTATAWTEDVAKNLNLIIDQYNSANNKLRKESIDNFLEIIKSSKDFAQQIADIERELQKDLADLSANSKGMSSEELERRRAELLKKAEEDKTKVRFEEFKESSDWVKVFDDLDRVSDATLDNMISKIEEFAKQAHLSEEVTKQLVEAMAKLRDETIERNPFEGFKDAWNRLSHWKNYDINAAYNKRYNDKTGKFEQILSKEEVENLKAESNSDVIKAAIEVVGKFDDVAKAADLLGGLFDSLGLSIGDTLGIFSDILSASASGAKTGADIVDAFGIKNAGPWGAIAGAAVGMLSSVFASHDKALQREIEASEARAKEIERMADNIESLLQRTMGGVYTFALDEDSRRDMQDLIEAFYVDDVLGNKKITKYKLYSEDTRKKAQEAIDEDSYFDAQMAALMASRDELNEQLRLEQKKKNENATKIGDYEQEIKSINIQIEELAKDMANTLYGIDFKDWAGQLAEALVNAWATGEDAVLAYKNTVDDILRDVGVSVISQQLIEDKLKPIMDDFVAQFEKDNGKITDETMSILDRMYGEAEWAAEATRAYLEGLKKLGIDLSESSESSKGGLSKEVQGVTEDTANLLGSYLNAIRQSVAVKQGLLEKLVSDDLPQMSYLAQAQLRELSQIQANTAKNVALVGEIRDLVNRVVDKGNNRLKV